MNDQNFIEIKGARQNNLKNISLNIPRNQITVVTGVSGSGKSSLAFETIYGEAQRRFLDSLPNFSKNRIAQLQKPEVDFIFGLSPVVAIEQKRGLANPRSTVGTMTDIYDYMRLLFATSGEIKCPYCTETFKPKTTGEIVESVLSLPNGTTVEFSVPIWKIYGETYEYLFTEVRQKGYHEVIVDGERVDLADKKEWDDYQAYDIKAIVDRFVVSPEIEKNMINTIETALEVIGEHTLMVEILSDDLDANLKADFYGSFGCKEHHLNMVDIEAHYFSFNNMSSACVTCGGIGTSKKADPRLMIINPEKSIHAGAFDPSVFNPKDKSAAKSLIFYNLARQYRFDLDEPFKLLSEEAKEIIFYGTKGEKLNIEPPPYPHKNNYMLGRTIQFTGLVNITERWYREATRRDKYNEMIMEWFNKKMVEFTCPDCHGKKLKPQRFNVLIQGKDIHELCWMELTDLIEFLEGLVFEDALKHIAEPILNEIKKRVALLVEIGLDYLSIGRRADTISGGEAQRIRLASQISSGLMGMIYILDEPSIGLHARDSIKVIKVLNHLRDLGNTVIVVEHDLETIENADFIVELGPGPGIHGGEVVEAGPIHQIRKSGTSLTGKFLMGKDLINTPSKRRQSSGHFLTIKGAKENNLKNLDIQIPLGVLTCVSGVSGSGKSTLINDILYKGLKSLSDPRIIPGVHEGILGTEHINDIINIDQSPIGKSSRSNPATYIGLFDNIRKLFAETDEAVTRGYNATNFSFNAKNSGRCEHCKGEGKIVTRLQFMPNVETVCPICKGKLYKKEILDVKYKDKSIYDVLDMSVEEAVVFFKGKNTIHHKLDVMNQLGLGYLKLGQSSNTLSGGEAQRIKLASELGKIKKNINNLYILDEPTTGLHIEDIKKLLKCFDHLLSKGHSIIVIEHNLEVLKTADHIIDLGPEGGKKGGLLVAAGTPEQVSSVMHSVTGQFLKKVL
ncbi:MAG: excinuclease ABC subunit UvrA [Clostridia bacterium]|nr:excinuclease ABC subunit UvrA [Clostridia bacterium]